MSKEALPPLPELNIVQRASHSWQVWRLLRVGYEWCAQQDQRAYNNFEDDEELAHDFEVTLDSEEAPVFDADNPNTPSTRESSKNHQLPPSTISFMGSVAFANAVVYAYQYMFKKGDK